MNKRENKKDDIANCHPILRKGLLFINKEKTHEKLRRKQTSQK